VSARRVRTVRTVRTVLLVGVSVRAIAESAARAGYGVIALDAFGDLDLLARAPGARSLPRDLGVPYGSVAAARAARGLECDAAAYVAGFENSPRAVAMLREERGRALWGNPPEVLRRVRDPVRLARAFAARGIRAPMVLAGARAARAGAAASHDRGGAPPRDQDNAGRTPERHRSVATRGGTLRAGTPLERDYTAGDAERHPSAATRGDSTRWLAKRRRSGGGHGVRAWTPGEPLARGSVLQERIDGTPGSVVFVADGAGRAVPIGMSRQLVGETAFGARGFTYCGSILGGAGDPQFDEDASLLASAAALATAAADAFALVGVGGVDFIARRGEAVPVEVNPRYSASMELVERAYGLSVFAEHARACEGGSLPAFDLARARGAGGGAVGKAIVYARRDLVLGDTAGWLDDDSLRDVPHSGERVPAGRPICTVLARGDDAADCQAALERRAALVYEEAECRRRRTA